MISNKTELENLKGSMASFLKDLDVVADSISVNLLPQ
jgi:hypothetical protein